MGGVTAQRSSGRQGGMGGLQELMRTPRLFIERQSGSLNIIERAAPNWRDERDSLSVRVHVYQYRMSETTELRDLFPLCRAVYSQRPLTIRAVCGCEQMFPLSAVPRNGRRCMMMSVSVCVGFTCRTVSASVSTVSATALIMSLSRKTGVTATP